LGGRVIFAFAKDRNQLLLPNLRHLARFSSFSLTTVSVPPRKLIELIIMLYRLPDINKDLMTFFRGYLFNKQFDCSEMLNSSLTELEHPVRQTMIPGTKEMWRQEKFSKLYT
jgi:hypothetical protein